jgi:hypothetical protein
MSLKWTDIGKNARKFVKNWKNTTGEEKQYDQKYLNDFFEVFGVSKDKYNFQYPVKMGDGATNWIDCLWKGVILIEMKSKGRGKQVLEDAHLQALDYYYRLDKDERPKFILVCDFESFWLYNMESADEEPVSFPLKDFPKCVRYFDILLGLETRWQPAGNDDLNLKAAYKMASLHDKMAALGYEGHELRVYLVRLLFCLFAEDTGIFGQDAFYDYIHGCKEDGSDLGVRIARLFEVLDMPPGVRERRPLLSDELKHFQYINGGLFKETLRTSDFDAGMRKVLLDCCDFNWEQIKPEIFGAIFQGVMDDQERRELGAHYTSEQNILKVIKPLFLNALWNEFERSKRSDKGLEAFQNKLSSLKFFDPACGCGNFLIVTYRELRRLELAVLKGLRDDYRQQVLDISAICKVNVDQFYGIEYEEFPSQIARVGMWLCDHLMNREAAEIFGGNMVRLPLHQAANITCGNALRIDWNDVISNQELSYLMGNPPFNGARTMQQHQKEDMSFVFGNLRRVGNLDYVTAWYQKAVEYIKGTNIEVAFVSTNSISQGEQPGILWKSLFRYGANINFAYRTFVWNSEARGKAAVHCVIIGFDCTNNATKVRYLWDENGIKHVAKNINPYLVDAPDILIDTRSKPFCDEPYMTFGSMANDNGGLILSKEERDELLEKEPAVGPYIKQFMMGKEFINAIERYCLWLVDCSPGDLRKMPEVMKRVTKVKKHRLESPRQATRKLADTPTLFGEIRQPTKPYLAVPKVSSERRLYVPVGFLLPEVIAGDKIYIIPDATMYHFGIFTSNVHMAWMRAVCGRLKSDYSYSNTIVYNNFPYPVVSDKEKQTIETLAQVIIDTRAKSPESSLADLYDPDVMPPELLKAHKALDKAVMTAYGLKTDNEAEIVAFLMKRNQELTT